MYNGTVPTPTGGGTPGAIGPATTGLPDPWEYRGCWVLVSSITITSETDRRHWN